MRATHIALTLSLVAVLASAFVAVRFFEGIPHLEDEFAYTWQATVIARGQLTTPSPPYHDSFMVPFVIDYNGQRFGKYPIGWPIVLALGVKLGVRFLVNPVLAGLGVWLTYRLGKRLFNPQIGLLAAGLTVTSPFFLMNSGSLLAHPLGLVLSAVFALAWLDSFYGETLSKDRSDKVNGSGKEIQAIRWLPTVAAVLALGALILTRPYTALGLTLPFIMHGIYLFLHGNLRRRIQLLVMTGIILLIASLHFVWQYALTGDAFLNPYTLWWPYDRIGFGPGHGHLPEGHTLEHAYNNTAYSLIIGGRDLFGWGWFSWLFLPFGLYAVRRNPKALLIFSVFPSLVLIYTAYWVGSSLLGPRYFYESLYSLTLISAAGIFWLGGRLRSRAWLVACLVIGLVFYNFIFVLPGRLTDMHGLYGIQRDNLKPLMTTQAQELQPAIIFVHSETWHSYGALLELEDPFLTTPFIFAVSVVPDRDWSVAEAFQGRKIIHYYPLTEPWVLYLAGD